MPKQRQMVSTSRRGDGATLRRLLLAGPVSIACALLAPGPGDARARPERVRVVSAGTSVLWSMDKARKQVYRFGDLTVTIKGVPMGHSKTFFDARLVVERPGAKPVEVPGGAVSRGHPHRVSFGNFGPGLPGVLFESYSGGAHCCNEMTAVTAEKGRLDVVPLGDWDGEYLKGFPTDLDRDGVADILRTDGKFLYAFSSYAGSYPPPRVLNVTGAGVVDVSKRPAFRSLFAKDAARARVACISGKWEQNGACAGYVASSARIGRFAPAWAEMLRHYDRDDHWRLPPGCRVTIIGGGQCPAVWVVTYKDYPEALRAFLVRNGYLGG